MKNFYDSSQKMVLVSGSNHAGKENVIQILLSLFNPIEIELIESLAEITDDNKHKMLIMKVSPEEALKLNQKAKNHGTKLILFYIWAKRKNIIDRIKAEHPNWDEETINKLLDQKDSLSNHSELPVEYLEIAEVIENFSKDTDEITALEMEKVIRKSHISVLKKSEPDYDSVGLGGGRHVSPCSLSIEEKQEQTV